MDIKKILLPTDFSPASRAAIGPAHVLAQRFGATLELLHVYEALPLGIPEWNVLGRDGTPVAAREFVKNLAHAEMDKLLAELRGRGITVSGRVESGNAWRVITQIAAEERHDLIVVATHGYHGVQRFVMGSVAEKVVRHAPCPVFVVRAEESA